MIGRQVGNFKIVERIGEGGMAVVYRAEHIHMGTSAAVKVLASNLAQNEKVRTRFTAEASVMAHLQHPNIVGVLDFIVEPDGLAIVMEFLGGATLEELLLERKTPMAVDEALPLFRQILEAVDFAHNHDVVHRDLKPSNVMVVRIGSKRVAKVLDFGLVKILGEGPQLTRTGAKMGTLWYMSPEQCRGARDVGRATDIYALGVILYQMLTATVPFGGNSDYEIMKGHVEVEPPLPSLAVSGLSVPIEQVVLKSLAKDPTQRWESCAGFMAALDEGVDRQPRVGKGLASQRHDAVRPNGAKVAPGQDKKKARRPTGAQLGSVSTHGPREQLADRSVAKIASSEEVLAAISLCGKAEAAEKEHRIEEALECYRRAAELDPSNTQALQGKDSLFESLAGEAEQAACAGNINDVYELLQVATDLVQSSPRLAENLASLENALLLGFVAAAENVDEADGPLAAMVFLEEVEQRFEAGPTLQKKREELAHKVRDLGPAGLLVLEARTLLKQGEWHLVFERIEEAKRLGAATDAISDVFLAAHIGLARRAMRNGNFGEAKRQLAKARDFVDADDEAQLELLDVLDSDLLRQRRGTRDGLLFLAFLVLGFVLFLLLGL